MAGATDAPRGAMFELADLCAAHAAQTQLSYRFLDVPSMRMSIYKLKAGMDDPQTAHADDEVYYVLEGRAKFRFDNEIRDVGPGSVVFVATNVPHKFIDIEEDLTLLVFFSHYKSKK